MAKLLLALTLPSIVAGVCNVAKSSCYVDDIKRILSGATYVGALTREYCAQFCSDKGFKLAGVEGTWPMLELGTIASRQHHR